MAPPSQPKIVALIHIILIINNQKIPKIKFRKKWYVNPESDVV